MAYKQSQRLYSLFSFSNCRKQTINLSGQSSASLLFNANSNKCTLACTRQKHYQSLQPQNYTPSSPCSTHIHKQMVHQQRHFSATSSLSGNAIQSRFTEDLDLEKLRAEVKRESQESGVHIQLVDRVRQIVAQRCAEAIQNLSEEEKKRLKVIQLEHNFLYSEGHDIPDTEAMTDENWLEAISLPSKAQRIKYYVFTQRKIHMKRAVQEKRAAHKLKVAARAKERYPHGTLMMRIYDQTIKKWYDYRLASSLQYGIPLVLDMDYDDFMRPQERKNTAKQLHDVYTINRSDERLDPFHLHFTNCQPGNSILKQMHIFLQDSPNLLATITEQSHLDMFDKDKLVYLSPHGKKVMRRFDPNAVYIVGAFNDKATQKPVSYARAIEQGIQCQRLPIDDHISWNMGSKNLTLDQMIKILLALKNGHSWKKAFSVIPQRKIRS